MQWDVKLGDFRGQVMGPNLPVHCRKQNTKTQNYFTLHQRIEFIWAQHRGIVAASLTLKAE
jgi:hypothetical protein